MENYQDKSCYRGLRALILTRVSTQMQGKNYSHSAQERHVRAELIRALGMYLADEERHVVHSNYTGLEYQYNEALDRILRMAEEGEFDVLCMDVLDRGLGRKAIAREIYRMQLRELGIHILTTEPSDHADDDSFEGQRARLQKGLKAEEEVLDIVRRTRNGKLEKALGDEAEDRPPKIVGTGYRLYGYKYVLNERGIRIGYELNLDVIYIDADDVEWTEVMVVRFIYESAANGASTYQICQMLYDKGIPTPFRTKGMKSKNVKEDIYWHSAHVSRMLHNSAYYGEYHHFKTASIGRKLGSKNQARRNTTEEEQVVLTIPSIVTKELAEKAQRRMTTNKQTAKRNNRLPVDGLLRGGFAKCAHCGTTLRVCEKVDARKLTGEEVRYYTYNCQRKYTPVGRCSGCSIPLELLDGAATEKILEIIRDPTEVDEKIAKLLADNPVKKQQQKKLKDLNKILVEQERMRANLASEMKKKVLSEQTVAFLGRDLADLERQEQEARKDLAVQQQVQQKQENLDRRIAEFHQQCQEWREKIDDSTFIPSFEFLSEACLFFGITATVWRIGTKPRYLIHTAPPDIMQLLS